MTPMMQREAGTMSIARRRRLLRVALWSLAGSSALTGITAALLPHAFYTSFPGGLSWVEKLPPYNQHLVSDVGGFYLAFMVLFAWAAVTLARPLLVPLAVAWILAETSHLTYHLLHLEGFDAADAIAQTTGFALLIALPVLILLVRDAGPPADGG
jgi:hypothetical protein